MGLKNSRSSAARAYLRPARRRPNLHVLTHALAEKVLLEGRKATGVRYRIGSELREATAARETILCAGALRSPQLLELSGIGDELRARGYRRPMMMIHNTGGMASVLRTSAVNTYNGGPVAGLMGSAWIGGLYGHSNVVATDMGGTSFDIGMVAAGSPRFYQFMPIIDRWVVDATIVDCHSIGAGGGSIAWIDELGAARVGPQSAGASPGPACFGLGGTEPTVTDCHLILGRLDALAHGTPERDAARELLGDALGIGRIGVDEVERLSVQRQ